MGRALGDGRWTEKVRGGARTYTFHWRDEHRRERQRMLGTNKARARQMAAALIRERDLRRAGLGGIAGQGLALRELAVEFFEHHRHVVCLQHYERSRGCINAILAGIPARTVGALAPEMVRRYMVRRLDEGAALRTVELEFGCFRHMLNWCEETDRIERNPVPRIRLHSAAGRRRHVRRRRRALSLQEQRDLIRAARELDEAGGDDRVPQAPLFLVLLRTGARLAALRRAAWGDVDLEARLLRARIETSKTAREAFLPMPPDVAEELERLQAAHKRLGLLPRGAARVFLGATGGTLTNAAAGSAWKRIRNRAGIARVDDLGRTVDIQALRHTFATTLCESGVDIRDAKDLLTHSTIRMTADVYTHVNADRLRSAISALPTLEAKRPDKARGKAGEK